MFLISGGMQEVLSLAKIALRTWAQSPLLLWIQRYEDWDGGNSVTMPATAIGYLTLHQEERTRKSYSRMWWLFQISPRISLAAKRWILSHILKKERSNTKGGNKKG
jgi:hypothetical protein